MFARAIFVFTTLEAAWNVEITSAINTSWNSHPRDTQVLVLQMSSFHDATIVFASKRDTSRTARRRPRRRESRTASSRISCENFATELETGHSPRRSNRLAF